MERELIGWILPEDIEGYRLVRDRILRYMVIGEGRRGGGEFLLGAPGTIPDIDSPLPGVIAYGAVETDFGTISITLREEKGGQSSLEIVNSRSEEIPAQFEESRRWTYSGWKQGSVCPQCTKPPREVSMQDRAGRIHLLAICTRDRRIWVLDGASGIVYPVPVTNFYNELMLRAGIRDPETALDSKRFFAECDRYDDRQLSLAFEAYNRFRTKIEVAGPLTVSGRANGSMMQSLRRLFTEGRE
jgi:hypothetical protein